MMQSGMKYHNNRKKPFRTPTMSIYQQNEGDTEVVSVQPKDKEPQSERMQDSRTRMSQKIIFNYNSSNGSKGDKRAAKENLMPHSKQPNVSPGPELVNG